jgi:hypothetical protein
LATIAHPILNYDSVWTAFLAPKRYSKLASWIVGWVSVAANLLLALSILFGGAQLIMS